MRREAPWGCPCSSTAADRLAFTNRCAPRVGRVLQVRGSTVAKLLSMDSSSKGRTCTSKHLVLILQVVLDCAIDRQT